MKVRSLGSDAFGAHGFELLHRGVGGERLVLVGAERHECDTAIVVVVNAPPVTFAGSS